MNTQMALQLKRLCYVRKGSGSTGGFTLIIVKQQTDENVEAADLLIRSMYGCVQRTSFGTYLVH